MTNHSNNAINKIKGIFNTGNSINLGFVFLLLVVLGCSCPERLSEFTKGGGSSSNSGTKATPEPTITPGKSTTTSSKAEYDVTKAKYDQLTIGMDRSKVEEILGGKGTEVSSSKGGNMRFSVNKWVGENYKSIILSFKNDKIMTKSQVGLDN